MRRFEIYNVKFEWRNCIDHRPVVVIAPQWYIDNLPRQDVLVAPLSSAIDIQDTRRHYVVESEHPDFAETGLKKTCYVAVDYITSMPRTELGKCVGELSSPLSDGLRSFLVDFFN